VKIAIAGNGYFGLYDCALLAQRKPEIAMVEKDHSDWTPSVALEEGLRQTILCFAEFA
jgi:hypothetical protein